MVQTKLFVSEAVWSSKPQFFHVQVRTAGNENSCSNGTVLSDVVKFHNMKKKMKGP